MDKNSSNRFADLANEIAPPNNNQAGLFPKNNDQQQTIEPAGGGATTPAQPVEPVQPSPSVLSVQSTAPQQLQQPDQSPQPEQQQPDLTANPVDNLAGNPVMQPAQPSANPLANATNLPAGFSSTSSATVNSLDQQPSMPANNKKPVNKKKLAILITAISVPSVLLIGFLLWFFLYWNNGAVVVTQAISNRLNAKMAAMKSDTTIDLNGSKLNINFEQGKNGDAIYAKANVAMADNKNIGGNLSLAYTKSDVYLRFNVGDDILKQYGVDQIPEVNNALDVWYKIPLKDAISDESQRNMFSAILNKVINQKDYVAQVVHTAYDTGYLVVKKVGSDKDGAIYEISTDASKTRKFFEAAIKTELVDDILEMKAKVEKREKSALTSEALSDKSIKEYSESVEKNSGKAKIKFWVKGLIHRELTKIEIATDNQKAKSVINVDDKPMKVEIPTETKTFSELLQSISSAMQNAKMPVESSVEAAQSTSSSAPSVDQNSETEFTTTLETSAQE